MAQLISIRDIFYVNKQIGFALHDSSVPHNEIHMLLHNRDQIYVPKTDEIYGSELTVLTPEMRPAGTTAIQYYKIKRKHIKGLDTPTKSCDEDRSKAHLTWCIASYLEKRIGCSMGLLRSDRQAPR